MTATEKDKKKKDDWMNVFFKRVGHNNLTISFIHYYLKKSGNTLSIRRQSRKGYISFTGSLITELKHERQAKTQLE